MIVVAYAKTKPPPKLTNPRTWYKFKWKRQWYKGNGIQGSVYLDLTIQ